MSLQFDMSYLPLYRRGACLVQGEFLILPDSSLTANLQVTDIDAMVYHWWNFVCKLHLFCE